MYMSTKTPSSKKPAKDMAKEKQVKMPMPMRGQRTMKNKTNKKSK